MKILIFIMIKNSKFKQSFEYEKIIKTVLTFYLKEIFSVNFLNYMIYKNYQIT